MNKTVLLMAVLAVLALPAIASADTLSFNHLVQNSEPDSFGSSAQNTLAFYDGDLSSKFGLAAAGALNSTSKGELKFGLSSSSTAGPNTACAVTATPEPATIALLSSGLGAFFIRRRRRHPKL